MPNPVDAYLAQKPPPARKVLRRVRAVLRRALPGAEEVISYGIPAYRQHRRVVVYFAGWKGHFSLYPITRRLEAALTEELAPYGLSHKGTVRFSYSEPPPARLISRIARFRLKELGDAQKAKRAKKR